MAIKNINNTNSGVKRPLRVSDLQDIWQGLNDALTANTAAAPRIVSGFALATGSSSVGAGTIAFGGQLYVMPAGLAAVGDTIYGDYNPVDVRTFADDLTYPFSYNYVVTKTATATSVLIGTLTVDNINAWSNAGIPVNSVGADKLAAALYPVPNFRMWCMGLVLTLDADHTVAPTLDLLNAPNTGTEDRVLEKIFANSGASAYWSMLGGVEVLIVSITKLSSATLQRGMCVVTPGGVGGTYPTLPGSLWWDCKVSSTLVTLTIWGAESGVLGFDMLFGANY